MTLSCVVTIMIRRVLRRAVSNAPTDGEREYEMDPEDLDDGNDNRDDE